MAAPAFYDGTWFVTSRMGGLVIVEPQRGKAVHTIALGKGECYASPAVGAGLAFVVDRTADSSAEACALFAVDLATRAVRWHKAVGDFGRSSAALVDGAVFVGTSTGVLALDAATGAERWRYETPDRAPVYAPVTVAGDAVLCGTFRGAHPTWSGEAIALDRATGAERWRVATGPTDWMSALATDGATVFTPTGNLGTLRALALADGATRWTAVIPGGVWAAPALSRGAVVVGGYDGAVRALDASTGAVRWVQQVSRRVFTAGPVVHDDVVYAGAGKELRALALADGAPRGEWKAPKEITCAPVIANGQLVVGCSDALVAL